MTTHRILIVDDNRAIHEDFRKILCPTVVDEALIETEAALFGPAATPEHTTSYELDFAAQGDEALSLVRRANAEQRPYSVAFIDIRMPPGWDGVETTARIWDCDADVQVVICTAFSDYSWKQMLTKLGHSDRLVILKKPFDNIEVLQLADSLTHKWQLARRTKGRVSQLEGMLAQRTSQLVESSARLEAVSQQLLQTNDLSVTPMTTQRRNRLVLESKLRHALENEKLTIHYQPIFDIASRRIVSLEALARWHDEEQGPITPTEFIPLAEENGLIMPLGEFVLRKVCKQIAQWQNEEVPVVPIAVNISAVQLQSQQLLAVIRNILRDTGARSDLLAIELTETALIKDMEAHVADLQKLRADGVQIEIDDFGTGYSSLSYLRRLPIDTLKIDRSFIKDVDVNPADESIVHAILAMAQTLRLKVIAEGVENAAQLNVLRMHGCEYAQGFYFGRAIPAEACRDLLVEAAKRPSFKPTLQLFADVQSTAEVAARKSL